VVKDIHDDFMHRFAESIKKIKQGNPLEASTNMGPVARIDLAETLERQLKQSLKAGASLQAGGERDGGNFQPTLIDQVAPGMAAFDEETFGPIVALYRFTNEDDAIARANDTRYGLNGSVWSRSIPHALRVAERLRVGTVNVNESYAATWTSTSSPIGGMKESGFGRRHGAEGIMKYTETQTIALQRGVPLAPLPLMTERTYGRVEMEQILVAAERNFRN